MEFATNCLHAGYSPKNGEAGALPIVQSTTFKYDTVQDIADLFDLKTSGFFYSRLSNPTVDAVEQKIAALEVGVGAICTSSGQAAIFIAVTNLCRAGDHIVAAENLYGGSTNLLGVTLKRFGIDVTFINQFASDEEIHAAFKPNTKLVYGETIANPSTEIFDISRFADIAHSHGVPLVVDNTFATPYLCRPFEHGADVVVHSTSKYLDGHALCLGGAVVDGGTFNWLDHGDKFPEFVEPDESYHGRIYAKDFGRAAYIVKARVQLIRDIGCLLSPQSAFYLNLGLETLPLRIEKHCQNALAVAKFLKNHDAIKTVKYSGLDDDFNHVNHELAKKYIKDAKTSGVLSVELKAGYDTAVKFIDSLKLIRLEVHVADIRSCILHPASSTHRQLNKEQLAAAGISDGLLRISLGLEDEKNLIEDIAQALEIATKS